MTTNDELMATHDGMEMADVPLEPIGLFRAPEAPAEPGAERAPKKARKPRLSEHEKLSAKGNMAAMELSRIATSLSSLVAPAQIIPQPQVAAPITIEARPRPEEMRPSPRRCEPCHGFRARSRWSSPRTTWPSSGARWPGSSRSGPELCHVVIYFVRARYSCSLFILQYWADVKAVTRQQCDYTITGAPLPVRLCASATTCGALLTTLMELGRHGDFTQIPRSARSTSAIGKASSFGWVYAPLARCASERHGAQWRTRVSSRRLR